MKANRNAILLSPSYQGTSFAEIADSITKVVSEQRMPIDLIGKQEHFTNDLPTDQLDDTRFLEAHHSNLADLFRGRYNRVLTMDFYGLGLDMVKYQADQEGRDIAFGALFHGASFMHRDVYTTGWISRFELAWGQLYSKIYSPSTDSLKDFPDDLQAKVRIFPWGMDTFKPTANPDIHKPLEVLFPHRLSDDKGITDLIEIATLLPDITIYITVPQTQAELEKNQYYPALKALPNIRFIVGESDEAHHQTLSQSKIVLSSAYQELFGYSTMKAVVSGAIPVLPNRQCYPHYFEPEYLYHTNAEAAARIRQLLSEQDAQDKIEASIASTRARIARFSFEAILKDFFDI